LPRYLKPKVGAYARPVNTGVQFSARSAGELFPSTFKITVGPSRFLTKLTIWSAQFSRASAADAAWSPSKSATDDSAELQVLQLCFLQPLTTTTFSIVHTTTYFVINIFVL